MLVFSKNVDTTLLSKPNRILIIQANIIITTIGIMHVVIMRTAIVSKNEVSVLSPLLTISDMPIPILEVKFDK